MRTGGTLYTLLVPPRSAERLYNYLILQTDEETELALLEGAGETEYLNLKVNAETNSHEAFLRIYCDEKLAFEWNPATLNVYGYAATTPGISLLAYGVAANCMIHLSLKFSFRDKLKITVQRKAGSGDTPVAVDGLVNLIT